MTERRIVENTLHTAIVALQNHLRALGPANASDAVLTVRVDGRASLELCNSRGYNVERTRQFHARENGEWVEQVREETP